MGNNELKGAPSNTMKEQLSISILAASLNNACHAFCLQFSLVSKGENETIVGRFVAVLVIFQM